MDGYHLVIKGVLHDVGLPDFIKDMSGAACGEHLRGKRAEKPHYHIWIPRCDDVDSLKSKTRDWYDKMIPDLDWKRNGNAYWTAFKEYDKLDNWIQYVFKTQSECKEPQVIFWNIDIPKPIILRPINELILPAVDGVVVEASPKKKKSKAQAVMFYEYMIDKYVGKRDKISKNCVKREYFKWSLYGFNDPQAVRNIRTVWYQLNMDYPELLDEECEGWISRTKIFSDDWV